MANPIAAPDIERHATKPLLIVAGTVVVVALVTFVLYSVGGYEDGDILAGGSAAKLATPVAAGACGTGQPDDSYSIAVASDPDPPRPEGTTFRLTVRQGGRAITGAKVCVTADMPTMQHPGLNTMAKELSGGKYETVIKFSMGGSWVASVTIAEPGKPVVTATVPVEVAQIE
jgi:hypothetical protein